jgi:hypothetical protein
MAKREQYTGRQLILQALDPLRRSHLEGKIEGLEAAARLIESKPDHSGRTLANLISGHITHTRMQIIAEAEGSEDKRPTKGGQ